MYYPESQITKNLYTNGGEFELIFDKTEYKGFYYSISTGKYYTGKDYSDPTTQELQSIIPKLIQPKINQPDKSILINEINTINYLNINNPEPNEYSQYVPPFNVTLPSIEDYNKGIFTRYFCKKSNELIYIEINKDTYDKLVNKDSNIMWSMYIPFNISWRLRGNKELVFVTNKNQVEFITNKNSYFMFPEYLRFEYVKYYI